LVWPDGPNSGHSKRGDVIASSEFDIDNILTDCWTAAFFS
jgi:hypothetical protein